MLIIICFKTKIVDVYNIYLTRLCEQVLNTRLVLTQGFPSVPLLSCGLHPEEPHFLLIAEEFLDSLLVFIPGCRNVIIIMILDGSTKFVLNNQKNVSKMNESSFWRGMKNYILAPTAGD